MKIEALIFDIGNVIISIRLASGCHGRLRSRLRKPEKPDAEKEFRGLMIRFEVGRNDRGRMFVPLGHSRNRISGG